jgi:ribosomal-protein-alanine N-acetyltransferase
VTVELRRLTTADLDRVEELEPALFGQGAWPRSVYVEELSASDRVYLAATEGGRLVGYAGVALGRDAEIMTIGVAPPWQGRGIGRRLLEALLDAARNARAQRVFLEVRASDERAQRLYARAGFRSVGLRRAYYQPEGVDAVVMRLDLPRPAPPGRPASVPAGSAPEEGAR